jgi:hypothetical protein
MNATLDKIHILEPFDIIKNHYMTGDFYRDDTDETQHTPKRNNAELSVSLKH